MQGRTRSNPISRGDLAYKKADDHGRQPVDIVDKSLRGQPQPQQQRSDDATDDGTPHGPEDRANRVTIVHLDGRGDTSAQLSNEGPL